jgi:hypothetical protein
MDKPDIKVLKELRNRPEWIELFKYLENRKAESITKIIKAEPTDVVTIANHQGRLAALDLVINVVLKD